MNCRGGGLCGTAGFQHRVALQAQNLCLNLGDDRVVFHDQQRPGRLGYSRWRWKCRDYQRVHRVPPAKDRWDRFHVTLPRSQSAGGPETRIFGQLNGWVGAEGGNAFRVKAVGSALFHAGALWPGLRLKRFAPAFASLPCARPVGRLWKRSWPGGGSCCRLALNMSLDSELQKHYALLLGVGSPWEVKNVELKLAEKKVEIELGWQWGAAAKCPECGRECSIHDCAPERTWRHLDTMQFTTLIRARTPRSDCPEHGVKTMAVAWAAPQGRFTLLFERFAVEVLLASGSISQACELLGISWETAQEIMRRAVERGLERRQLEDLKHLGMDEKSFKRGQSYVTLL